MPNQQQPNLICAIQGTTDSTIVIGVNANYKSTGEEPEVDWADLTAFKQLAMKKLSPGRTW